MKKHIFITLAVLISLVRVSAQVDFSTYPVSEPHDNTSIMQVSADTKGFLAPRMTLAQRNLISSPATGLLIYQTNNNPGFYYYDGSQWTTINGSENIWEITGNEGTVDGTHFVGTTDNVTLNFRVNNQRAGSADNNKRNTFLGYKTGQLNTLGYGNCALGYKSLTGDPSYAFNTNTAIGALTLENLTTSHNNVALGAYVLTNNETANENTAAGYKALYYNTVEQQNVAIGAFAMYNQIYENSHNSWNTDNVAVGFAAMYNNNPSDVTHGIQNVAVGDSALYGVHNEHGYGEVALGHQALFSEDQSYYSTAAGYRALYSNTSGNYNTALGELALYDNTTGDGNTAAGKYAGHYMNGPTTGSNNTCIGYNSTPENNSRNNTIAIRGNGYGDIHITGSNEAAFGDWDMTSIGGQVAWTALSDERIKTNIKENVPGLDFINKLTPVTYNFKRESIIMDNKRVYRNNTGVIRTGLLAQDVYKAAQELNFDFDGVDKPENPDDVWGMRYALLTVPLIKAVQENQQMIEETQESIEAAQKSAEKLQQLEKELEKLKDNLNQR